MNTTTSVVATGVTVTVGQWASEKRLSIKVFVGIAAMAIFLSIMESGNEKLAQQFGVLILVSAVLIYGVPIGKKLGGLK